MVRKNGNVRKTNKKLKKERTNNMKTPKLTQTRHFKKIAASAIAITSKFLFTHLHNRKTAVPKYLGAAAFFCVFSRRKGNLRGVTLFLAWFWE